MNEHDILTRARGVLDTEIEALAHVRDALGPPFAELVRRCLDTLQNGGKLVLSGIGKSGHIGRKMAATLSSTGSQAVFMHPVEAMHGDLGLLDGKDLLLALSYSGETDELLSVLPAARRLGVEIAAITGSADCRLSTWAGLTVPMQVPREACPFNLAPTATTTALLALGDALALVLLEARRFDASDYALLHPAGAIGRSVTLRVSDIMRTGDRFPTVPAEATVRDGLLAMTEARGGAVAVLGAEQHLLGILTDGDLRRHLVRDTQVITAPITSVMTADPITIPRDAMAVDVVHTLEHHKIDDVLVVDADGRAVGIVDIQDLPRLKIM